MVQVNLYIGDITHVREQVRTHLDGNLSGVMYDQNTRGSHSHLQWISLSGRQHKREDIQHIFDVTQYTQSAEDPVYVVLEYADCLTHAAANSMLKLLEEPPAGYVFFLLAVSEDSVLPTIRSRCQVYRFVSHHAYAHHALYQLFTRRDHLSMYDVYATVDTHVPTEYETRILLEAILDHWINTYQQAQHERVRHKARMADRMVQIMRNAMPYIPTSGNVKLFWRMLLAQVNLEKDS